MPYFASLAVITAVVFLSISPVFAQGSSSRQTQDCRVETPQGPIACPKTHKDS